MQITHPFTGSLVVDTLPLLLTTVFSLVTDYPFIGRKNIAKCECETLEDQPARIFSRRLEHGDVDACKKGGFSNTVSLGKSSHRFDKNLSL